MTLSLLFFDSVAQLFFKLVLTINKRRHVYMFVQELTVFLFFYSENEDNTSACRLDMAGDNRKY